MVKNQKGVRENKGGLQLLLQPVLDNQMASWFSRKLLSLQSNTYYTLITIVLLVKDWQLKK